MILMGSSVKSGRYSDEAEPEDIAPTIERIFGLEERTETDSRVLEEALR